MDIHLGDGQFEGAFAAEAFFQSAGIKVHVTAHLGHGEADVAHAGGDGLAFEAIGIALPFFRAFVRLGLECMAAFDFHGLINDQADGFADAVQAVIEDVLHGGIILTIFVLVGHAFYLFVFGLGRPRQKNRFDPP